MLRVHRPGGNAAGVARSIRGPVLAEDERDGSIQHQQAHIERVGVGLTVHVGLDLAITNLIAFPMKLGLEFRSVHGSPPSYGLVSAMLADPKREEKIGADHRDVTWMLAADARQLLPSLTSFTVVLSSAHTSR